VEKRDIQWTAHSTTSAKGSFNRMEMLVSSRWTPLYKYVIPLALGALIGYGDYVAWIAHHSAIRNSLTGILSRESWPLLLLVSAAVMGSLLWMAIPLKQVVLTGDGLWVSNFLWKAFVPLAEVQEVSSLGWTQPRRATIRFRIRTRFGRKITVIPPMQRSFDSRAESQVLEKMRRAMLLH
jgi:hypothetical protein